MSVKVTAPVISLPFNALIAAVIVATDGRHVRIVADEIIERLQSRAVT